MEHAGTDGRFNPTVLRSNQKIADLAIELLNDDPYSTPADWGTTLNGLQSSNSRKSSKK